VGRKKIVQTPVPMSKSILRFLMSSSAPVENNFSQSDYENSDIRVQDDVSLLEESVAKIQNVIPSKEINDVALATVESTQSTSIVCESIQNTLLTPKEKKYDSGTKSLTKENKIIKQNKQSTHNERNQIKKVSVIEKDYNLFGFNWMNNSCSFDTVVTIIIFFCRSLSPEMKNDVEKSWGVFGEILSTIDPRSAGSVASAKEIVMPLFFTGSSDSFHEGEFSSLTLVYEFLCELIVGNNDVIRIRYEVEKFCEKIECEEHQLSRYQTKKRELSHFESARKNDKEPDDTTVIELMENYWARRIHICPNCKVNLEVKRNFFANPLILAVSVAGMATEIDTILTFEGSTYDIFAVGYLGIGHLIAFIKVENEIFEYDGMYDNGKLHLVGNSVDSFQKEILGLKHRRKMKANMIWYMKNNQ
jgi:hypothetical protein